MSSNELEGQESFPVYQFSNSDAHWNPLELCKSRGQGPLGQDWAAALFKVHLVQGVETIKSG